MLPEGVRIERSLTLEQFKQMEELELTCYSSDYITPAVESYNWYRCHPHSTLVACEGAEIVGFVNLLPVRRDLFELIQTGRFNDSNMTASDILPLDGCADRPIELFLSCIVVHERFRGSGLARSLAAMALAPYLEEGTSCRFVVTDNVTPDGVRFSECLGFEFVCESDHGSRIYQCEIAKLVETLDVSACSL